MPRSLRLMSGASLALIGLSALAQAQGCQTMEADIDRVPEIEKWERQMIEFGHRTASILDPENPHSDPIRRRAQYYDAGWIFYQIGEYTGDDEPWASYARLADTVYKTGYLEPNDYVAQGFRRFPHGMFESMQRGFDVTQEDMERLRDKPSYSKPFRPVVDKVGAASRLSREIAYAVQANVYAEKAGASRKIDDGKVRLSAFIPWMGSHLYEWRTQKFQGGEITGRVAPFMFALSAHALIEFYEWEIANDRDPNEYWPKEFPLDYHGKGRTKPYIHWETIEDALLDTALWLATEARMQSHPDRRLLVALDGGYTAFRYEDVGNSKASPDLNLLIAPVYAWLYKISGNYEYRKIADSLFGGGVSNGYMAPGKHFNQHYRLSFLYLKWRREGDAKIQAELAGCPSRPAA